MHGIFKAEQVVSRNAFFGIPCTIEREVPRTFTLKEGDVATHAQKRFSQKVYRGIDEGGWGALWRHHSKIGIKGRWA